jgi:hypothetical protein
VCDSICCSSLLLTYSQRYGYEPAQIFARVNTHLAKGQRQRSNIVLSINQSTRVRHECIMSFVSLYLSSSCHFLINIINIISHVLLFVVTSSHKRVRPLPSPIVISLLTLYLIISSMPSLVSYQHHIHNGTVHLIQRSHHHNNYD